jgi:PilZ domain-containing protein
MQERLEVSGPGGTPRAPRYAVPLPLSFRLAGDADWHEGTISNASRSGILFVADVAWPPETPVELRFTLATALAPDRSPVTCDGIVVRSLPGSTVDGRAAMAARISAYRFGGPSEDAGA